MASSETPVESPPTARADGPPPMPAETAPAPAPTAPPPVASNAFVPAAPPGGRVTRLAKLAAAILILFGILFTLGGLLFNLRDFGGLFGAGFASLGIVFLVIGIIETLAGIGAWRGNGVGRVVGIIFGVLGALLSVSVGLVYLLLFGYVARVLPFRWKAPVTA